MDFGEAADCSCLTFMVVFPFDYEYAIHLHTYQVVAEIKDKQFIADKVFHLYSLNMMFDVIICVIFFWIN